MRLVWRRGTGIDRCTSLSISVRIRIRVRDNKRGDIAFFLDLCWYNSVVAIVAALVGTTRPRDAVDSTVCIARSNRVIVDDLSHVNHQCLYVSHFYFAFPHEYFSSFYFSLAGKFAH